VSFKPGAGHLEEAIIALQPCVHVFADPSSIKPREIGGLMDRMRALIDEEVASDQCNEARVILAGMFNGSRTPRASLDDVVRWAVAAQPISKVLSAILAADNTAQARSQIGEVLEAERSAKELLERVSATAKVDVQHFSEGCDSWREVAQKLHLAADDR